MSTEPIRWPDVAADIAGQAPPEGAVACWWLGQAGLALRGGGSTMYIDPFLSEGHGRAVPPPFAPEAAPPADLVLITHEHLDHLDPGAVPGLAGSSPNARFIAPSPIVGQLLALGVPEERATGVQPGEVVEHGGVRVHPLPAMHGLSAPPAVYSFGREESGGRYRFLGYVVEIAGVRLYHSGDTVVYDGMVERLAGMAVDAAFLPINGRTYFREQLDLIGNMEEREAADLAAAAGVTLLVPMHYDMFAANTGRPGLLVEYVRAQHPELSVLVPSHGRRFTVVAGG